MAVAVDRLVHRVAPGIRPACSSLAVVLVVIALAAVTVARRLDVFEVADVTARALEAGDQLRRLLPPNAVLIAGEQSGSMRY